MTDFIKSMLFAAVCIYLAVCAINALYNIAPFGRDDSDEPGWFGKRSNMEITTDQLTGCQYLITRGGHITPRLDAEGRQVCAKKEGQA